MSRSCWYSPDRPTAVQVANWTRQLQHQRKTEGGYCALHPLLASLLASLLAMANPCAMGFCHNYFLCT